MNITNFIEEYNVIFERSLIFSIISRSIGVISLENLLDKNKYNQRDIFEFGMRLVMDGRAPELIDKILTNLINIETDLDRKTLKKIQKDVVLLIQQGNSPEELMWIMNSYVNIELDIAEKKYKEINDFISKELSSEYNKKQDNYIEIYKHITEEIVNKYYKNENNISSI